MGKGQRRVGLFGGSFDPIHFGHLILGQDLLESGRIDELWFIPAGDTPLRDAGTEAPARDRLAMARIACAGRPGTEVLELEVKRTGKSYSVDTLEALRAEHPDVLFHWILGTDRFVQMADWKDPERLAELTAFIVLKRPGHAYPAASDLPGRIRWEAVEQRILEISSTEIRNRIREGKPVDLLLPEGVNTYIQNHNLYQHPQQLRAESITSAYG